MTVFGLRDLAFVGAAGNVADPYFSNVSLLLHGDGSNGSTTFTDSSSSPKTITRFGDAQISTAQSKFGGSSMLFDGNGDYLTIPGSTAFDITSGEFCIEFWMYRTANAFHTIIGYNQSGSGTLFWDVGVGNDNSTANKLVFRYNGNNGVLRGSTTITNNTWHHVAFSRDFTTIRIFLNGTVEASVSASVGSIPNTGPLAIARNIYGLGYDNYFNGYIDDLRFTKGVARYTANFTPPTAPFPDF